MAKEMGSEAAFCPDQYTNMNNPCAHYESTAEEIWRDTAGRLDVVVAGVGTGGTISGVGRRLKELNHNIIVVGVDPLGSVLGGNDSDRDGCWLVEGIGYDHFPETLARDVVDKWVKVSDQESFLMARKMISKEALLVGGSSGAAMAGAIKVARELRLGPNKRIVVIAPDSTRNYMSKFLCDNWMLINGFLKPADVIKGWKYETHGMRRVKDLPPGRRIPLLDEGNRAGLRSLLGKDQPLVAVCERGRLIGYIRIENFAARVIREGSSVYNLSLRRHLSKEFVLVTGNTDLHTAAAYVATGYPVFYINHELGEAEEAPSMEGRDHVMLLEPHHFIDSSFSLAPALTEGDEKPRN